MKSTFSKSFLHKEQNFYIIIFSNNYQNEYLNIQRKKKNTQCQQLYKISSAITSFCYLFLSQAVKDTRLPHVIIS